MKEKALNRKINFVVWVEVKGANPNGDPLADNRPRTDLDGYGIMSGVCVKRKIRNRLQDFGEKIILPLRKRADDEAKSPEERAKYLKKIKDEDELVAAACDRWTDVRYFGHVFKRKGAGCASIGIRGPVSVNWVKSVDPVQIYTVARERHFVEFGLYKIEGSVNAYTAEKTGFSYKDAETLKKCLITLFENDESSFRPDGSMKIRKVYWWEHDCKSGTYNSYDVFESVTVKKKEGVRNPSSIDDYIFEEKTLPGLTPEIIIP